MADDPNGSRLVVPRLFSGVTDDPKTAIRSSGRLTWDPVGRELAVHDGETPGGLPTVATFQTREQMKARVRGAAYLSEPGRAGRFLFDPTISVATHQSDPSEGIYAAPDPALPGAWVRQGVISLCPEWFGAKGDAILVRDGYPLGTDDSAAFAAMAQYAVSPANRFAIEIRLSPGRSYLLNSTWEIFHGYLLSIAGGFGSAILLGIGIAKDVAGIKFRDSGHCVARDFTMTGNPNLPTGFVFENGGTLNTSGRTTAAMAQITLDNINFNNGSGTFNMTSCVAITDTQAFMDNNSEHKFSNCFFWGYGRSAIRSESRNSLQNLVIGNRFENPPLNNRDVYALETVSVMRAPGRGDAPTVPIEQGGGGFMIGGGNEFQIHGGLFSSRSSASTVFYFRGELLHDFEISNVTVEDNCRILDVDISSTNQNGIVNISVVACHQKGGVQNLPMVNIKTGSMRLVVDLIGCSFGLGQTGTINVDGANAYLNVTGGVLNTASITGTGNVSLLGVFGAAGELVVADTLRSFSALAYQGTYKYKGFTVDGLAAYSAFKQMVTYDNIVIRKPGAVLALAAPNGKLTSLQAGDGEGVVFVSPQFGETTPFRSMLTARTTGLRNTAGDGTAKPAGASGFITVRTSYGEYDVAAYPPTTGS